MEPLEHNDNSSKPQKIWWKPHFFVLLVTIVAIYACRDSKPDACPLISRSTDLENITNLSSTATLALEQIEFACESLTNDKGNESMRSWLSHNIRILAEELFRNGYTESAYLFAKQLTMLNPTDIGSRLFAIYLIDRLLESSDTGLNRGALIHEREILVAQATTLAETQG